MIVRKIAIIMLALVTLVSTGGVHMIVHHCLHSGDRQIHFVELHGCCTDGDDHCADGACSAGCCHQEQAATKESLQGKCCTDTIQFLKTDNACRGSVAMTPVSEWVVIKNSTTDFNRILQIQPFPIQEATILRAPPGAPSPCKLCTFRT